MILVAMQTAFSNLFHINSMELQGCFIKFVWLELIRYLKDHPEFYVESISNISWELIMSVKVLELL